jgi:hypothetical protein
VPKISSPADDFHQSRDGPGIGRPRVVDLVRSGDEIRGDVGYCSRTPFRWRDGLSVRVASSGECCRSVGRALPVCLDLDSGDRVGASSARGALASLVIESLEGERGSSSALSRHCGFFAIVRPVSSSSRLW